MIELLAQLSQLPPIINYRSDMSRSCPGFTLEDNYRISETAVNYLMSTNPHIKRGNIRIYFLMELVSANQESIHRFIDFIRAETEDHKFIYFCHVVENIFSLDSILSEAAHYISRTFNIPYESQDGLINNLGLSQIGRINGGNLYYVRPR